MLAIEDFPEYHVPGAKQVQFNPYESNGGWVELNTQNFVWGYAIMTVNFFLCPLDLLWLLLVTIML